jgi:hypothetical protein
MKKLSLGLLFIVCSVFCSAQTISSGQLFLSVYNDQTQFYCGVDRIDMTITEAKVELKTTHGNLDLTVLAKSSDEGQIRCKDMADNLYTVQAMKNEGSGGVGYMFVPDLGHRMTFFVGTTPVCDK